MEHHSLSSSAEQEEVRSRFCLIAQRIAMAGMTLLVLGGLAVEILAHNGVRPAVGAVGDDSVMRYALYICTALIVGATWILRKNMHTSYAQKQFRLAAITLVLCSSIGLYGLMLYLFTAQTGDFHVFMVFALGLTAFHYPKEEVWRRQAQADASYAVAPPGFMQSLIWQSPERLVLRQGLKERLAAMIIIAFPVITLFVLFMVGAPATYTVPLAVFCSLCVALQLTWEHEILLDRESRSIIIYKSMLGRKRVRQLSWDEGESLSIETVVGGGQQTSVNYTIFFATTTGETIALYSSSFEEKTRDRGEEIARFLEMDLQEGLDVHRKELTPKQLMLRVALLFGGVIVILIGVLIFYTTQ